MGNKQLGFALIEWIIIVAIIGILATLAIPAYRDHLIRARVSELVIAASSGKKIISQNILNNDSATDGNACDGWASPAATTIVASITCTYASGVITATGTDLTGNDKATIIYLTPSYITDSGVRTVKWACLTNQPQFAPAECR